VSAPRIPPSRRRLLERVGYGTVESLARSSGGTVDDVRQMLRDLDEWEVDAVDDAGAPRRVHVFERGRHLWFEPAGTGPEDCEMVRLVLEQNQHTLVSGRGGEG